MKKIRILFIEDNRLISETITAMLKKQHDMNVLASNGNGENISQIMNKFKPDIIILNHGLRNQSSLQIVKLNKQNFPLTKIIVMDLLPIQSDVLKFIKAGVSGFILKDANITEYYKTIRSVYKGIQVLPSLLAGTLFSQINENSIPGSKPSVVIKSIRLSKREQQVMKLISGGCTNKEIALKLEISTFTVKSHVHNILEKLSLHTRVEIAKYSYMSASNQTAKITTALMDDQL